MSNDPPPVPGNLLRIHQYQEKFGIAYLCTLTRHKDKENVGTGR